MCTAQANIPFGKIQLSPALISGIAFSPREEFDSYPEWTVALSMLVHRANYCAYSSLRPALTPLAMLGEQVSSTWATPAARTVIAGASED